MYVHYRRRRDPADVRASFPVVDDRRIIEEWLASMLKRVLLIDDDPIFVERLRGMLGSTVHLHVASDEEDAIAACYAWRPHLILLDVLFAPGDPFRILDDISSSDSGLSAAVLCLSQGAGSTTRVQTFGNTIFGILKRETEPDTMLSTITRALRIPEGVAA